MVFRNRDDVGGAPSGSLRSGGRNISGPDERPVRDDAGANKLGPKQRHTVVMLIRAMLDHGLQAAREDEVPRTTIVTPLSEAEPADPRARQDDHALGARHGVITGQAAQSTRDAADEGSQDAGGDDSA